MSYDNLFWGSIPVPNHTQWRIQAESLLANRDVFHPTAAKKFPLGAIADSRDGRRWRYQENSGAAILVKALMNQQAIKTDNWVNQDQDTGTAASVGDKSIKIFVTTAPSAGDWIDGVLTIQDGEGEYEAYLIKEHDASLLPLVHLADTGGIRVATLETSTGTEITIMKNTYKDVIVCPTTLTGRPTGVSLATVPIDYFFWGQTLGWCPMRVDNGDTVTVGDPVGIGDTTPGNVKQRATTKGAFGWAMTSVGEADGTCLVDLQLE